MDCDGVLTALQKCGFGALNPRMSDVPRLGHNGRYTAFKVGDLVLCSILTFVEVEFEVIFSTKSSAAREGVATGAAGTPIASAAAPC